MSRDPVTGIILAAGRSRRLGRPKQLLPFGETTLLGRVVENALAGPLEQVVLVLGPGMTEIARALARPGLQIVQTPETAPACSVSLQTGVAAAPESSAVVLLLGDQPGVTPAIVAGVLAGWRRAQRPVAVASYRGLPGHPFVLSGPALAEVAALSGEKAVWALLQAHPEWVHTVPVDRTLPRDVDVWEDYLALLAEYGLPLPAAVSGGPGEGGARP